MINLHKPKLIVSIVLLYVLIMAFASAIPITSAAAWNFTVTTVPTTNWAIGVNSPSPPYIPVAVSSYGLPLNWEVRTSGSAGQKTMPAENVWYVIAFESGNGKPDEWLSLPGLKFVAWSDGYYEAVNTAAPPVTQRIFIGPLPLVEAPLPVARVPLGGVATTKTQSPILPWDTARRIYLMKTLGSDVSATVNEARRGQKIDVFRGKVIKSLDAAFIAMQTGVADVYRDLIRTGDIEQLTADGHTVTYDAGFHIGHIGFNIRPLNEQWADPDHTIPRRTDTTIWPLADVVFRHALLHCYDQEAIVTSIYGYTVTPLQSLVPPTLGGWANPSVPKHPFNPGNPFTSPPTEDSSCGILKAAGYIFVDVGTTGVVDSYDYWTIGGVKLPQMVLWSPTYEAAPTSAEHCARFAADLAEICLVATTENGKAGIEHKPAEFADYMDKVATGLFDAYMVFWQVGRFPDYLYDMCHSSQICGPAPEEKGRFNRPGINDPDIDAAVAIIKESLNHAAKLQAAYDVQELLYDPEASDQALAYMQVYSRVLFNAFNEDLRGIVKSPGFSSNNGWTYLNIYWAPGTERYVSGTTKTLISWLVGTVEGLNPCYALTGYSWDLMGRTMDGLMDVDPYTHRDLPAMSSRLPTIVETATAMEITYYIRPDIFWQDGTPYTAHDAKFNWDFFKYNQVPIYTTTWSYIDNVVVIDDYTVKVTTTSKSQFLVYDMANIAALLPPNVWGPLNNTGLPNILAYDPSTDTSAAGMGPWFGTAAGPSTHLFGTGELIFDYWDPVGQVWEGHQNPNYYRVTEDVQEQMTEILHEVGDANRDGTVWAEDRGDMGGRYGSWYWQPRYSLPVDVTEDGKIDFIDLSYANFHFGEQKEYP